MAGGRRIGIGKTPRVTKPVAKKGDIIIKDISGRDVVLAPNKSPNRPEWAEGLTDREWRFVTEYVGTLDAAYAAEVAGLSHCKTEKRFRMLSHIAEAVDKAIATAAGPLRVQVMDEIAAMAFHQPADYFSFDEKGMKLKKSEDLTPRQMLSVKSVKQTRGKNPSLQIELADKSANLDKLARATGLYKDDKPGAGGNVNVQIVFSDSDKRLL